MYNFLIITLFCYNTDYIMDPKNSVITKFQCIYILLLRFQKNLVKIFPHQFMLWNFTTLYLVGTDHMHPTVRYQVHGPQYSVHRLIFNDIIIFLWPNNHALTTLKKLIKHFQTSPEHSSLFLLSCFRLQNTQWRNNHMSWVDKVQGPPRSKGPRGFKWNKFYSIYL